MSFADTGFGQLREAGPYPSRSAVIGVIAAALGVERGNSRLVDLHQRLRIHTGTAHVGSLLTDYHTVLPNGYEEYDATRLRRSGAEGNPVLTDRTYHVDAHFVAFISSDDPIIVSECRDAFKNPVFTGYLGRRCCVPTTPLIPETTLETTIVDALGVVMQQTHQQRVNALPPWERKRKQRTYFDAYIDGVKFDDPKRCNALTIAISSRRDLLVALPRSYVNRSVTHIRIVPPDVVEPVSYTTKEFFDDAP